MIHMPRRSVTRFFIPLIDVLLLTFGVFLLMPIAAESELEEERQRTVEKSDSALALQQALQERLKELYKLEELRPDLERVDELKKEIQLLRNRAQQALQTLTVKVIEVDPASGDIAYDPARAEQPLVRIGDAKTAQALIEEHRKEAPGRNLYYQFLRRHAPYPTIKQVRQYREWFKDVPNSLEVQR
jgi:predicted Zn-dependent protease